MSFLVRRFTRIGSKNKFIMFGLVLTVLLFGSQRVQTRVATGTPILREAGETIQSLFFNLLPFKALGEHLSSFGESFKSFTGDFSDSINNIFSPIKDFLEWGKSYLPSSAQAQEDEGVG